MKAILAAAALMIIGFAADVPKLVSRDWVPHIIAEGFPNQTVVRLVDMDGDGDLDILVAGFESNNVVWYENRMQKRPKR